MEACKHFFKTIIEHTSISVRLKGNIWHNNIKINLNGKHNLESQIDYVGKDITKEIIVTGN